MEKPDAQLEFRDDEFGALVRRQAALETTLLSEAVIFDCTKRGMSRGRAIDKITASQLFKITFPSGRKLSESLAQATFLMELRDKEGRVRATVHRLPNGTWIEPEFGHFILPSTPWAQILEQEYQRQCTNPSSPVLSCKGEPLEEKEIHKPRRKWRALLKSLLVMGS